MLSAQLQAHSLGTQLPGGLVVSLALIRRPVPISAVLALLCGLSAAITPGPLTLRVGLSARPSFFWNNAKDSLRLPVHLYQTPFQTGPPFSGTLEPQGLRGECFLLTLNLF